MMLPVAILMGGTATRLRPVTETIPKALIDIAGEPFLAHQLRLLAASGIERVVCCVGYLGEMIRDYADTGEQFGLQIQYSFDGPALLGTGGALRQALPLLGENFFALYGDSYLPCDYRLVQQTFAASLKPALMTVYRNEGRWDTSNVLLDQQRIVRYDKRIPTAEMRHIDYGLGVFHRSVFAALEPGVPADLADVYSTLAARGDLAACEVHERFFEIGSFDGIAEFTRLKGS